MDGNFALLISCPVTWVHPQSIQSPPDHDGRKWESGKSLGNRNVLCAHHPRAVFSISDAHVPRTSVMTIQCTEKGQEGYYSTSGNLCPVEGCKSLWTGKQLGKRQIRRILSCSCALFAKFAIEVCRKVILPQAAYQPLSFKLYALYPLFFSSWLT
jgi:hypothetical protein